MCFAGNSHADDFSSLQAMEGSHQTGDSGWNHPALPDAGEQSAQHEAAFDVLRAGP
jgi:hypothetical protein